MPIIPGQKANEYILLNIAATVPGLRAGEILYEWFLLSFATRRGKNRTIRQPSTVEPGTSMVGCHTGRPLLYS